VDERRDGVQLWRWLVEVLDEKGFVADLAVEKFVDGTASEEKTEASGVLRLFFFLFVHKRDGVFAGVGDDVGADEFLAEAGARVADVEDDGSAGPHGGDVDPLFRIEGGAVLDGVEEYLAEPLQDLITREFVDLGAKFAGEAHEAVGGEEAAVGPDGDPAGAGGEDGDIVLEEIAGGCLARDGGDLLNVERRREAGEDMGAQGGDDLVRRAGGGKDDAFDGGTDEAHLFEKSQVLVDGGGGTGDDDGKGVRANALKGADGAGDVFDGDPGGGETVSDGVGGTVVAAYDENPAHWHGLLIAEVCVKGPVLMIDETLKGGAVADR